MRGRRPKPTRLKVLTGNPGKRPLNHDEPRPAPEIPECPPIRMSPHDPQNAIFNSGRAVAHYLAGRYAEAVGFARKAMQQRGGMTMAHRIYIASLAQAGEIDESRAALEKLKELQPDVSIEWIEQHVPYTAVQMPKFLEGVRKAGIAD